MKKFGGVTLLELMIVLAVVGILAGVAYPSYTRYVTRARRADGLASLVDLQARMERYFSTNHTYASATVAAGVGTTDVLVSNTSPDGMYTLSISAQTASTYTVQTAPTGAQATADTKCATLTLNNLGVKGITGTGAVSDCW